MSSFGSCQEDFKGPGFDFSLFHNTPVQKLAQSVKDNDTTQIKNLIITEKVPVNYQENKFGQTLLTYSIVYNKNFAMQKLLELGADPNLRSSFDDGTPFLKACFFCNELSSPRRTLDALILYGADVNAVQNDMSPNQFGKPKNYRTSALVMTCLYGNLECVQALVENGADLNIEGKNEKSIVSISLMADKLDIVKYLLIDKRLPIPDYCTIRGEGQPNEKRMTPSDLLKEHDYANDPRKRKLKEEILSFIERNTRK